MPITRENLDGDDYRASGFVLHLRADVGASVSLVHSVLSNPEMSLKRVDN